MPLGAELLEAYRNARYVVFGEARGAPDLVFKIGEPSAELDAILEAEGAGSAAYVSACNPGGELARQDENEAASAALGVSLSEAGYLCLQGEGRDPLGQWPAERSYLIVGIARGDAERLGRAFEQKAVVFVEKGRAPELIVL